jgi:spore germination protein YaaH
MMMQLLLSMPPLLLAAINRHPAAPAAPISLSSFPRCSCAYMTLCEPLHTRPPSPEVHVWTDNGTQEPRLDNWKHFNWSVIDTVVRMSGHPLQVQADGTVAIGSRSAWPDSELLCTAHSHGVRVVVVVLSNHKGDPAFFTKLLGNASAVKVMAGQLASAVAAAGFDGLEFDFETITASTAAAQFDVGQAHVAMVKETATAVAVAVPNATTTLTMGCLNASDTHVFAQYFRDYPVAELSRVADGLFVMAYDMWMARGYCAGPNAPLEHIQSNLATWIEAGAVRSKLLLGIPWYGLEYSCHDEYPLPPPYIPGGFARTDWCPAAEGGRRSTCRDGFVDHIANRTTGYRDLAFWLLTQRLRNGTASGRCQQGWSERWQSPFYDCASDEPFSGGRVQGWFDDARSTRTKVELAQSLGLGGWGVFAADQLGAAAGPDSTAMWSALDK